jgi:uncharacterized protein
LPSLLDMVSRGPALATLALIIGFIVGVVGLGGVLLAPVLNVVGGMPIHDAVRLCMWIYVGTGLVGTAIFVRYGYVRYGMLWAIAAGACPGAFAGALALGAIGAFYLEMIIVAVILFSGAYTLISFEPPAGNDSLIGGVALFFIGFLTGVGSALTGTSGPLFLLPILLFAHVGVKSAIGLAQAIQVPIGVVATAANLMTGRVELAQGLAMMVVISAGILAGATVAHRATNSQVRRWLGMGLVLMGLGYIYLRME